MSNLLIFQTLLDNVVYACPINDGKILFNSKLYTCEEFLESVTDIEDILIEKEWKHFQPKIFTERFNKSKRRIIFSMKYDIAVAKYKWPKEYKPTINTLQHTNHLAINYC